MGEGEPGQPGPITGVETGRHRQAQPGPRGLRGWGILPPPPVRGWLFEQVEGISNTVNTGALDKTVRAFSSSAGAALALRVQTQGDANADKQRLRSGGA